jgi:cystathionine beta-lyase
VQNAEGSGLGPFDCWLLLRGVKTMGIRMEKQVANCERIAAFLERHPLVTKINYPGLRRHPRSSVQREQAMNGGSLLSFETGRCEELR